MKVHNTCKGWVKDAVGMLSRAPKTKCSELKAWRKRIDGLVHPGPREIIIHLPPGGTFGEIQRPLRAQTAQGERICLAYSETVPAGSWIEFEVVLLDPGLVGVIVECLEYGKLRGLFQWRNAGFGRFTYEIEET